MTILATSQNLLNTTLQRWLKGFDNQTTNIHPVLAMLRAKAKIKYDASGLYVEKTQKNKQHQLEGYADFDRLSFTRTPVFERARVPFRAVQMTSAISEKEARQNKGAPALVRYFAGKLEEMKEDAEDQIGRILYLDGELPANAKLPHGFMSFMGYTAGSQNADDAFATVPSDTYAELSTILGNYGGSGTNDGTTFRADSQTPEWNAFTPVIVNSVYNDGGGALSWAANAEDLISRAEVHANRSGKERDSIDAFCMSRAKMVELRQALRTKERIVVERGSRNSMLVELGFKGVINVDGVDCMIDSDVPVLDGSGKEIEAVGWNCNRVKLELLCSESGKKEFWNDSGSAYDVDQKIYKFYVGSMLNLLFEPRYQALITQCAA